jgi:chorismate--pyruvate lyase
MVLKRCPNWQSVDSYKISYPTKDIQHWLEDKSSLTLKIKEYCQYHHLEKFSVQVLSQQQAIAESDEIQTLNLAYEQSVLLREVLLLCGKTPVIFARTVIPMETLTGTEYQLGHLGNKPLGEFLFSQANLQRDTMEIAQINQGHQLFDTAQSHDTVSVSDYLWARRSIFRLQHKPLLVAEVLLSPLLVC